MRRDVLYVQDILASVAAIDRFIGGRTRDDFLDDELLQSAVLHQLMIVGEAAARLSDELKGSHPSIPWRDITGFRNIVVHAYFSVDLDIVWTAATSDAPRLRTWAAALHADEE